ncbi:MAG: DUF1700 domain-containing protein [Coprococcus sp.]
MNKQEYLSAIRVRIPKMPTEDMERFIAYYSEMIDDRMEDGMTEEEAVAMMDTPDDAVDQILEDTPLSKIVKQKIKPTHRLRAWEIVLIVLGSPVWVPLLLTAGILVLSMLVVVFSLLITFYAVVISASSRGNCGSFSCGSIPDDQQCSGSDIYAWVRIRRCRTYDSVLCRSEAGNGWILESV